MQWKGNKAFPLTRQELNKIHKQLFDIQTSGQWKQNWKDIRDYINPNIGFFEEDNPNQGERKDYKMVDTHPLLANNIQAAGMQDGITSPWRPWFKLTVNNPAMADDQDSKLWFDIVSQTMVNVLNQSNFYDNSNEFYKELGAAATAAMAVEEDPDHGVYFRNFTIGEYAIGTDSRNKVNRFARLIRMPVAEIVDKFGLDNCPQVVNNLWQSKNIEKHLNVKQLIIPNPVVTEQGKFWWQMPYVAFYWIDESGYTDDYLSIEGYHEFPVAVCRWSTRGADIYGRGPGWYALGDAKELQSTVYDESLIRAKIGDPPMVANEDLKRSGSINTLPGGVTFYSPTVSNNGAAMTPLSTTNTGSALPALEAQKQSLIDTINQHFFVDLFRMLEGLQQGNITAQEIIQRVQEKMSQLGPVLTRVQHEFLQPVIERTFGICMRNGIFPAPPQSLQGQEIKIEYVSVLAQAQKMTGLTSIQQLLAFIQQAAGLNQNALDKLNVDDTIDRYAESLGTPASMINSTDACQQMRQQRQQAQQAQEALAAADQSAKTAQTLSQTPVGQNSALDALIPGAGG